METHGENKAESRKKFIYFLQQRLLIIYFKTPQLNTKKSNGRGGDTTQQLPQH